MRHYDLLIIGCGAAGMHLAVHVHALHPEYSILIADREKTPGGILNQCLHSGFGELTFREALTGPEYARRLFALLEKTNAELLLQTTVLSVSENRTALLSSSSGLSRISFQHLVLATGCRERNVGSLFVHGTRPSGVYTAGQMQRMINLHRVCPGSNAVIIGSGDIGLILARRLILQHVRVSAITELLEHCPALPKNQKDCLHSYNLPLHTSTKLFEIHGEPKITGVTIQNTKTMDTQFIPCDLLLIASGLIPEQSLLDRFPRPLPDWISLCGNCSHVHPFADAIAVHAKKVAEQLTDRSIV